ncbi:MAG: tetratricopeptide repeat protein [Phycisphaerales bacterium]
MDRRTENLQSPVISRTGSSPFRSVLLASVLMLSSGMLTSVGGCKAVRERRAQRAAEKQRDKETQAEWMARQRLAIDNAIANDSAHPSASSPASSSPNTQPVQVKQTDSSGMQIVDDRPSAQSKANGANPPMTDDPHIEIIEQSNKRFNQQSKEEASYARAIELRTSGDLVSALRELERAIAYNPQFTLAFLEAGDIYSEMAEYDLAERQYALAVRNEPRNFMAQYRHAQVLHRLGQLQDANRAYLRALSIRPGDFDANLGISIVLLEMGKIEQAMPYAQRAVRSDPPSGRARMHLGNIYAAVDRHEEAVVEYQQAAELMDAPSPDLLLNMAESLNALGRYAEMVGALEQLVRIDPNPIAYERLGSGLFRLKRYEESLQAFRHSADIDPTHYPAYNGIAVCELNQYLWSSKTDAGARQRAVDAMRKSLRLNRKQPRIVELLRRYSKASSTEK